MTDTNDRRNETLLFQRLLVSPRDGSIEGDAALHTAKTCAIRVAGQGQYVPVSLSTVLGDTCQNAVFLATEGMAAKMTNTDSVRAVYLLRGQFDTTVETMSNLKVRGDIDFEGTIQQGFVSEQRIATMDNDTGEMKAVKDSQPSEFRIVNRLDGEQSEFFSRVEEIAVVTPALPGADTENAGELHYEELLRMDVSTLRREQPRRCDKSELHSASVLGEGVLIWPSFERQSDRYGFVRLLCEPVEGSEHVALQLDDLVDLEGTLICEVLETRQSSVADLFRGLSAETPERGELIELGEGTLTAGEDNSVGISPNDGREIDWLNPKALYQCHLQTVRLYFLPHTEHDGTGVENE